MSFCSLSDLYIYQNGLVCFQRSGVDPVPGCLGEGQNNHDYCIDEQNAIYLNDIGNGLGSNSYGKYFFMGDSCL